MYNFNLYLHLVLAPQPVYSTPHHHQIQQQVPDLPASLDLPPRCPLLLQLVFSLFLPGSFSCKE